MSIAQLTAETAAALAATEPTKHGYRQASVERDGITCTMTFTAARGWRHPAKTTTQFKRAGKVVSRAALLAEETAGAVSAVAEAVQPRRDACVARALESAQSCVDRVLAELAAAGWDADKVAPSPTHAVGQAYRLAQEKRQLVMSLTTSVAATLRHGEPHIVRRSDKGIERFMERCRRDAEDQFKAYVAKLAQKIGHADHAELSGGALWDGSVLTVHKGELIEHWSTKQIVNCSVLGKLFNQWPTRLQK